AITACADFAADGVKGGVSSQHQGLEIAHGCRSRFVSQLLFVGNLAIAHEVKTRISDSDGQNL
ncbi:MAG: hypothetical protein RL307_1054, partial [Pseudomonadota bacterium]